MSTKTARHKSIIPVRQSQLLPDPVPADAASYEGHLSLPAIRSQVADHQAIRAIRKSKLNPDGIKLGVSFTLSNGVEFLQGVSAKIQEVMHHSHSNNSGEGGGEYLLAVATNDALLMVGSNEEYITRAIALTSSKFIGRMDIQESQMTDQKTSWIVPILSIGSSNSYDDTYHEAALWDVLRKSTAPALLDPMAPPPGSKSIAQLLNDARARLVRLRPAEVYAQLTDPSFPLIVCLVDIRPEKQRLEEGSIEGCLVIERNVLEWRFDPRCEARLAIADRYDLRVIVFCSEGYTSSLAAASLQVSPLPPSYFP